MKLLAECCSRVFAVFYVLGKMAGKRRKNVTNKSVLLIEWGNMGDTLIDANTIITLFNHYTEEGKEVTIVGTKRTKSALEKIKEFDSSYICCLTEGSLTFNNIKTNLSRLRKDGYETIISLLPWSNWPSLYIPACLPCNEAWGVFHERREAVPQQLFKHILSKCYNNSFVVSINTQQAQRNKLIVQGIGISDFQTKIIAIPPKDIPLRLISDTHYVVLSVDSLDTARRWPTENFVDLAYQLLDQYDYDIFLTGYNIERGAFLTYESAFADNPRVHIMIGKLDTETWIETIRNGKFIVTLDSGSVHIAASVGTVCFCLAGVWDGHRILPYAIDKKTDYTTEPICVYRKDVNINELTCYGCFARRQYGWGNNECYALCKAGQPCLCLSKITPDDVMNVIHHAQETGAIK